MTADTNFDNFAPRVSIITVVFNAKAQLERTIANIRQQNYQNIEYIIIDGGSKDGGLELIQANRDIIKHTISEPDKGIYDAMNKGLKLASGDYICFINAGDGILSPDFLEEIFAKPKPAKSLSDFADIYYGQTLLVDSEFKPAGMRRLKAPRVLKPESFLMGMLVCHQSILIKKDLVQEYDLRYKCSADFDWVIKSLKKAKSIQNTHQIMASYLKGGASRSMLLRSWGERFMIMCRHFGLLRALISHIRICFRALLQPFLFLGKKNKAANKAKHN